MISLKQKKCNDLWLDFSKHYALSRLYSPLPQANALKHKPNKRNGLRRFQVETLCALVEWVQGQCPQCYKNNESQWWLVIAEDWETKKWSWRGWVACTMFSQLQRCNKLPTSGMELPTKGRSNFDHFSKEMLVDRTDAEVGKAAKPL